MDIIVDQQCTITSRRLIGDLIPIVEHQLCLSPVQLPVDRDCDMNSVQIAAAAREIPIQHAVATLLIHAVTSTGFATIRRVV
jgi:hypothetical protein